MQFSRDDPAADWTLPGVYEVASGLYRIPLPLPEDGLRAVNVYAVRDGDGLVMVDSGWALTAARDLLEQAVRALGCGLADVRRFLVTHVHRDHYTMAVAVRREFGTRVALGRGEAGTLRVVQGRAGHGALLAPLRRGGAARLARELARLPDGHRPEDWADPDEWIDAPADIKLAAATLQAYRRPGIPAGTAAEVARRMTWTRRERTFGELDLLSQCLAVTETLAHLDVLVAAGRLHETDPDGTAYFSA